MEKVFLDQPEPFTGKLRAYIEYWVKHDQRYRTRFWGKYYGLSIYDIYIEKRYTIYDEDVQFVNKFGYYLIGNPDNPYGASTDHEYFLIHDDLFDRIL